MTPYDFGKKLNLDFYPVKGRGGAKIRELEENTGARIKARQPLLYKPNKCSHDGFDNDD